MNEEESDRSTLAPTEVESAEKKEVDQGRRAAMLKMAKYTAPVLLATLASHDAKAFGVSGPCFPWFPLGD